MASNRESQICNSCGQEKSLTEFYLKDKVKLRYSKTCKQCEKQKRDNRNGGVITFNQQDSYTPEEEFQMVLDFFSTLSSWSEEL